MDAEITAKKLAILSGLAGNFSAKLEPETSKLWLTLLAPYTVEQVSAAAMDIIRTVDNCQYGHLPPFAVMQKRLDALTGEVRGEAGKSLAAETEWLTLMEQVSACGSYREPKLSPTTALVVRQLGGWDCVCRWRRADLDFKRRDFLALWNDASGHEDVLSLGVQNAIGIQNATCPNLSLEGPSNRSNAEKQAIDRPPDIETLRRRLNGISYEKAKLPKSGLTSVADLAKKFSQRKNEYAPVPVEN